MNKWKVSKILTEVNSEADTLVTARMLRQQELLVGYVVSDVSMWVSLEFVMLRRIVVPLERSSFAPWISIGFLLYTSMH
ncbi:Uncharacterized protein TCM_019007 [Theobroma cacao]|uniref:Uncharacterized protein n=1 Tax=Theobroma cacao TaxID=3641 RepID=A0A061EFY8_THECC|nr:Uncharacterized protein TCM_019007 [Theobroma cacao]